MALIDDPIYEPIPIVDLPRVRRLAQQMSEAVEMVKACEAGIIRLLRQQTDLVAVQFTNAVNGMPYVAYLGHQGEALEARPLKTARDMGLVYQEGDEPRPVSLTNGYGTVSLSRDRDGTARGTQTLNISDEDIDEAAKHAAAGDTLGANPVPHVQPIPRGADAVADSPTDSGDRPLPVPSDDDWDRRDPVPPLVSDHPARLVPHPGHKIPAPKLAGQFTPLYPIQGVPESPEPSYSPAPRPPRADEDDIPVEEMRRTDLP